MTGEDLDSKPAIYPWGPPMEEESVKVNFLSSIPAGQSSKKGDSILVYESKTSLAIYPGSFFGRKRIFESIFV